MKSTVKETILSKASMLMCFCLISLISNHEVYFLLLLFRLILCHVKELFVCILENREC